MKNDDAIPATFKITPEERKEAWKDTPVTKVPSTTLQPKEMSQEQQDFYKLLLEQKQRKAQARSNKRQAKAGPNPKTHRWDSASNCWVADKIYQAEENVRPDFNNLNSPELVKVFNEMAVEAAKLDIPVTATKRFSTRDAGLRRCEELYKTITEKKGESYERPAKAVNGAAKPEKTKVTQKTSEPKPIKKDKPEPDEITKACKVRPGSLHAKILQCLYKKLGEQVTEAAIIKHIYPDKGPGHKTNRIQDLMTVMSTKVYIVRKEKDEKGNVSYGLYKNDQ